MNRAIAHATSLFLLAGAYSLHAQSKPDLATAVATGQVQGKAVSTASLSVAALPVNGVTITAVRVSPNPVVTVQTTSAKDGTFTIGTLPTGRYNICLTDKSGTYLDPCQWLDAGVTVDVVNGSITSGVNLRVPVASVLQVRVNNLSNALSAKPSDAFLPHVLVAVRDATGAVHPAVETTHDPTGISYTVRIPFDSPLRLQVLSKQVTLETTNHVPVPAQGLIQSFQHDSTKAAALQPSFQFNAIGRNP